MSTLRHITGDRWEVRVYDPHRKSGKRGRSFRATGPADARRKAPAIETALRAEAAHDAQQIGTITDLTRRWLRSPRANTWSPTTSRRYRHIAATITRDLGNVRADKLRAADVDDWLQRIATEPYRRSPTGQARTRSPQTVAHHRAVLRAILMQAERWELIDSARAARNSTPPRLPARRPTPPTDDTLSLLISTAPPELAAAAMLAALAGLRRGEIAGLQWADIDGDTIHIRRAIVAGPGGTPVAKPPKSGRERSVIVAPAVLATLATLPRTGSYLFPDHLDGGDRPRHPDWITGAWRRHASRHHATGVRFHDLRHWHATSLLLEGVSVRVVAERLGHAQASTTLNVYAHPSVAADRAASTAATGRLALPAGP